jgi:hypothetical protein
LDYMATFGTGLRPLSLLLLSLGTIWKKEVRFRGQPTPCPLLFR